MLTKTEYSQWNSQRQNILPISKRLPFDWKTPRGYLVAVILLYIITVYTQFGCTNLLAVPIAAFVFAISVIEDIENVLVSINESTINAQAREMGAQAQATQLQTIKQFTIFIETHSNLKQLS